MMKTYKIRAEQTVIYEITVEAESLEAAIEAVENDEPTDMYEVDNTAFKATAYIAPGGFGMWEELEHKANKE
jgi:hypothetical protein